MQRSKFNIAECNLIRNTDFSKQYFTSYCVRLSSFIKCLEQKIAEKWGTGANIKELCDIQPDEKCIVIGTLYKEMENKPSVLKELTDSHQLGIRPIPPHKLISEDDSLFLEDSQQRIRLHPTTIKSHEFVTGIVVALFGYEPENTKGKFMVEDIIYPTPKFPLLRSVSEESCSQYIAIVSGLQLNDESRNSVLLKLFFDWLSGYLPFNNMNVDPKSIGRLIIAGDSIVENAEDKMASQNKFLIKKSEVNSAVNVAELDELLSGVCRSIPVDIMPGFLDPGSMLLPQKPMHKVLFTQSRKWSSFNSRPNPWLFYMDNGGLAVGTSGQTIDDIDRYSSIDNPLDRLEATIKWGHLAPTAPDTLPTYPNCGPTDPLVLPYKPSLYFAGNQNQFMWKNLDYDNGNSSLLVTVPRFRETGEIVLVDVLNKNCRSLVFQ